MNGDTRRLYTRKYYEAPVMYKRAGVPNYYEAVMYNNSIDGLYFESDYALKPGTELNIKILNNPTAVFGAIASDTYRVVVKWCVEKAVYNDCCFGVGVQRKWNKVLPMFNLKLDKYSWSTVKM